MERVLEQRAALPRPLPDAAPPGDERRTRDRVCREILERGPLAATQLADLLELTPAAVRRHLDALLADGVVDTWHAVDRAPRGRGRPARRYVLTDAGHAAMSTAYDDLAAAALQFISDSAGEGAVRDFAAARAGQLVARYRPSVNAAGPDLRHRAAALAEALDGDGYAASTRPVTRAVADTTSVVVPTREESGGAVQLCQGHCPVQHVASRFPQLCEAETEAFSELLGVHVQRLSTLANGAHVCTTHVPGAGSVQLWAGTRSSQHPNLAPTQESAS